MLGPARLCEHGATGKELILIPQIPRHRRRKDATINRFPTSQRIRPADHRRLVWIILKDNRLSRCPAPSGAQCFAIRALTQPAGRARFRHRGSLLEGLEWAISE